MIEWIAIIVLGLVEGITEFLPISSTGHLLLTEHLFKELFGLPQRSDLFNTVIQCGAVLAVVVLFTRRVQATDLPVAGTRRTAVPVQAGGGFLHHGDGRRRPEEGRPRTAGDGRTRGLGDADRRFRHLRGGALGERQAASGAKYAGSSAIVVGFAQLLAAVFPGTSRSGRRFLAPWPPGRDRRPATEFSFLWAFRHCSRPGPCRFSMPGRMPTCMASI